MAIIAVLLITYIITISIGPKSNSALNPTNNNLNEQINTAPVYAPDNNANKPLINPEGNYIPLPVEPTNPKPKDK